MHVFVLAGQSNMSGRGNVQLCEGVKRFLPYDSADVNDKIFRFSADAKWMAAEEPLHGDIDTRCCLPRLSRVRAPCNPFTHACSINAHSSICAGNSLELDQGWRLRDTCSARSLLLDAWA